MKKQKNRLEGNIWKTYAFQIFDVSISFMVPIIVLFWQGNGLSLTEIMILQSFFSIAVTVLEVPSGYFADIHGRKKSLLIGAIGLTIGIIAYSLGTDFISFLIAELFLAVGASFISGADSALLYDSLKDLGREKEYKAIWGSASFYALIGMAVANIIGGFVGKVDLRYPLYIAIPLTALMIPLALSVQEPKRHKKIYEKGYAHELFRILHEDVWKNPKLRWIMIYGAFLLTMVQGALWLYQPYMKMTGLDVAYFGIVFALFNVVAGLSAKYSENIEKKIGNNASFIFLIIIIAVSFFLMSTFLFVFSFLFILLHQFVRGSSKVFISDAIHNIASSDHRATIISTQSMVSRLAYAMIIPVLGYFADSTGIITVFYAMGVFSILSGIILITAFKKNQVLQ